MKVLFFPRERFPTNRVRINVLFGTELVARGHKIDLIMQAASHTTVAGAYPWHGQTVWVGPTDDGNGLLRRIRKHWLGLVHDLRWLLSVRHRDYDAILISDKFLLASLSCLIAPLKGIKSIFWLTFPEPEAQIARAREGAGRYPWLTGLRGRICSLFLYHWILRRCDYVFSQTERMKKNICVRARIDESKVMPIVTGFSLEHIQPVSASLPVENAGVRLVYLGTLDADRHLEILIDMVALLRQAGVSPKLLFVGDAEVARDRHMLEQRAGRLGVLDNIEITGYLPHAIAIERIKSAHIGLSPIFRSPILDVGSPTKLVEYMAVGLPVIANDHPEQKMILRQSRAGICVPWRARYFARAVACLMRLDGAQRALMGSRGRMWIEQNRSYSRIADDIERAYFSAIVKSV